jgi:hypothetical protein
MSTNVSTIASMSSINRNSLLRSIALGGVILAIAQFIVGEWFLYSVVDKTPFEVVLQYVASGALGMSAFEDGTATALLGVLFHLLISLVIAGVFILSVDRTPLLRRYAIAGVYGVGVYFVMNHIVIPLSAAPPLPDPTTRQFIERIIEHGLVIGLTLGILVRPNAYLTKWFSR